MGVLRTMVKYKVIYEYTLFHFIMRFVNADDINFYIIKIKILCITLSAYYCEKKAQISFMTFRIQFPELLYYDFSVCHVEAKG